MVRSELPDEFSRSMRKRLSRVSGPFWVRIGVRVGVRVIVRVWVRVGVCVGDRGYDWGPDVDEPSRQEVCPKL